MNNDIYQVGPKIRMALPTLTSKEQSVVRYLLDKGSAIGQLTIAKAAQDNSVSDAMIVKIAKKLGYDGYRDLRDSLYGYSQLAVSNLFEEFSPTDSASEIVDKVFRTAIQALEETRAILRIDDFNAAVTALYTAQQRDFYGVGGSSTIARDAAHKFLRIGIRSTAYDDPHMMMMSAALLSAQDVVLAISHSGQTSAILDAVRQAKRSGARLIALTNYNTSALAREADIVLCSTGRGSPLMGENAAARIAQLNILDALFVCVARQSSEDAERALEKTMHSVQKKRET
ncbi:MAG: MurR/RpiR family transcriptional regulator [Anaerolineae bacterium]|nr:MurR/RpiR family transcriptional regulator [Anaerolineae bacterium]MDW8172089.1 MurR/RpiR family transcriptional regulator [Anaerolineae bacterium]